MDRNVDEMLSSAPPDFDADAALARFRDRAARERLVSTRSWLDAAMARISLGGGWLRPAAAAVAVLVVATALAMTGIAETLLTVFEPQRVETVRVQPSDLSGVPDPSEYGALTWISKPAWRAASDANAAASAAGFAPLTPSTLPANVPSQVSFAVMGQGKATFQFDEAKARDAAARVGATAPPMPAAIAATTLTMTGGPAVMQQYGGARDVQPDSAAWGGNPPLLIVQARAPLVTSNGATVDELRDYALAQPGIPADLAAQIRAIGDPVRTLLVPIGVDLQDARAVTVRGTKGYLVGDQTGLGSGVVWLENGYVVGVLGTLTETELLSLVNGLR